MPRQKLADMSQDERTAYDARKAELAATPRVPATERNITVTVGVEAIAAAKALGVLSGLSYREVLGNAAAQGVDSLVAQVQAKLNPETPETAMPF
jgi:predicted transcriptional regulator